MLTSRGSAAVPATGVGVTGGGPASQAAPRRATASTSRARYARRRTGGTGGVSSGTDGVYGATPGTAGARLDTPHAAPHRSRTVAQRRHVLRHEDPLGPPVTTRSTILRD